MAILIDLKTAGDTKSIERKLLRIKTKTTSTTLKKLTQDIPHASTASINSLYSNIKTLSEDDRAALGENEILDVGTIFVKRQGKQIGTVEGNHKSIDNVLKAFRNGGDNYIALSFPEVDSTRALIIKPTTSDLSVKKDGRTLNTWNIGLTQSAITKYRKELEQAVYRSTVKELNKVLTTEQSSGVALKIAARLGVTADSITLTGSSKSIVGQDISAFVRDEVAKRMSKSGTSDSALNYRTGDFVNSIDAKVQTRGLISYTFNKEYAIHEKPIGTVTTIHAKPGKVLAFTNKKTGDKVFTKSVNVRSRPVIKESIRTVALKLFNKKFRLGMLGLK